jgi:hypothetical protein
MITGYISHAATTEGLSVVLMGLVGMIGAVGVSGNLKVRYLASRKVCNATPARGVPKKNDTINNSASGAPHFEKGKEKTRTALRGADGQHVRTRPILR